MSARVSGFIEETGGVMPIFTFCLCVRTAAKIWRCTDTERKKDDPKVPRHTNLRVPMYYSALSLHTSMCVRVVSTLPAKHHCLCVVMCPCAYVRFRSVQAPYSYSCS